MRCASDTGNRGKTCAHKKAVGMWLQSFLAMGDDTFAKQYYSAKSDDLDDDDFEQCVSPSLYRFLPNTSRYLSPSIRVILTQYATGERVYPSVFEPIDKVC